MWTLFANDSQLLSLVSDPTTIDEKNNRFRREDFPVDVITIDDTDFLSFYFPDAVATRNHLINKGILNIDYYCSSRYGASLLAKRVKEIINANFDLYKVYEGQKASGIVGVYKYREKYAPLVLS